MYNGEKETGDEEKDEDHLDFDDDESCNFGEGEFINSDFPRRDKSHRQAAQLRREISPPLLTFPITSQKTQDDTSSVFSYDSQEEQGEEESDQPIEEWMILGGEEQEEDSSIQLNLAYWDDSEDDDMTDVKSVSDIWAVSDKDKDGAAQPLRTRYFVPGRFSICNLCNKTGHFARNCTSHKKRPTCVLCGIQGHIQRDCQSRPCPKCGLPPHGLSPCRVPSVWKQHCQRCGMMGHLSDACPDTWRQYHLTVKVGVPFRPRSVCSLRHKNRRAHCYNCSKRGHYGFECINRRMVSGTFPSLPYVIYYDTQEDILHRGTRMDRKAKRDKELVNAGSLQQEHLFEKTEDCKEKEWKSKKKQEAGVRRKTWPERRKERREVKRLRREAQAKREGGFLGRSWCKSDVEVCTTNRFRHSLHGCGLFLPLQEKKKRIEKDAKKSRKNREAERWKKRGGIKRGDLYPHPDMDIGSENFLSPKQRVRHRRR
uniref:Zinc finger CCHC domain-containing protein 7 n=2 Tax=Nothobranchius rachovii TaxID=451742 RepID=A0A1A8NWG8_9TELE